MSGCGELCNTVTLLSSSWLIHILHVLLTHYYNIFILVETIICLF